MPQAGLTGSKNVQQSPQYAALKEFVSEGKALGDAQDKFCAPTENEWMSSQNTEEVEEHLTTSWKAIMATAAMTSLKDANMPKLVNFVLSLQSRPQLQNNSQTCQVQGMSVWHDLPTFAWQVRDAWNLAADENSEQESKEQWINVNAFTATLLASAHSKTNEKTNDKPDLSLQCLWSVRQALEEQNASDVALGAAAAWFVFAAPTVWDFCRQGKSFEGKVAQPGSAFQEQGWTGFTKERWQTWEKKLSDVQGQMSDDTMQLVEQAREAMNEVKQ